MNRIPIRLLLLVFAGMFPISAQSAENSLHARIVLFISKDAKPPENYEKRLQSLALRTESFFADWGKHWKRPIERETVFARNEDGEIEVILVRGKIESNGRAALPDVRAQAVEGAVNQLGLRPRQPVVWWILYDYPNVKGFQGGARGPGGIAINAYPPGTETIGINVELAEPKMADMAIKGTIHEFGHALGLPHIGPRPKLRLGNSLMGPINRAYWSKANSNETKVHLTEASATLLQKHPIFGVEQRSEFQKPSRVAINKLEVVESGNDKIRVTGKLSASHPAHSVVLLDSQRRNFGDYWARSYVGAVDGNSDEFQIDVTDPFDSGTLYLGFSFDNGFNTGDGRTSFQQGSSVKITYKGSSGSRQFNISR